VLVLVLKISSVPITETIEEIAAATESDARV